MIAVALVALALTVAPAGAVPPNPVPPSPEPIAVPGADTAEGAAAPPAFYSAAKEARKLLDAGDPIGAATKYEQALAERPNSAEAAYNLGVALHRSDKFAEASAAFARAATLASQGEATNAKLAADSLYNRAAGYYNSTREQAEAAQLALKLREQKSDQPRSEAPPVDTEALKQAIKDARTSLQGFKDAAIANPADRDARVNAEQSSRLIRALEELQRMQEQQKNQQQQKDQQEQQDQKDQEQKDQEKQEQKNSEQQNKESENQEQNSEDPPPDSDKGKEGDKNQEEKKEQEKKEQGEQQDKKGDESKDDQQPEPKDPKDEEKKKDQQGQDEKEPKEQEPREAKGSETQSMTKDEANRLLQAVRDAEKKRRAQMEQRNSQSQARSRLPAKDW